MKVKVRVQGLSELSVTLKELPKATHRNVLRRVLAEMAEPFIREAETRAPEDTGQLRESIDASPRLTRRQRGLSGVIRTESGSFKSHKKDSTELYIGPSATGAQRAPAPSGVLQEFGTANQAPQPFMRPAWDMHKRTALETAKTKLAEAIDKAAKRLAAKAQRAARNIT